MCFPFGVDKYIVRFCLSKLDSQFCWQIKIQILVHSIGGQACRMQSGPASCTSKSFQHHCCNSQTFLFSSRMWELGRQLFALSATSATWKVEKLVSRCVKCQQFNGPPGGGALYSCQSRQQNCDLEAVGATPGFVASANPSTKLLMLLGCFWDVAKCWYLIIWSSFHNTLLFPGCHRLLQLSPRSRTWKAKPTLGAPCDGWTHSTMNLQQATSIKWAWTVWINSKHRGKTGNFGPFWVSKSLAPLPKRLKCYVLHHAHYFLLMV